MTFDAIFKKAFLNGFNPANINSQFVLITLLITCIIGLYIFFIYRLTSKKIFYSLSFNISLVATAVITATIIFTIQSSIVISLGMVGALSIVRFRTAIKDPLDLVFLFWSISVGIICGAGFAQFAVFLSLILTAVLFGLSKIKDIIQPQILVVNANSSEAEKQIIEYCKNNCKRYKIKSKNISNKVYNIVIELSIDQENTIITDIEKFEHVYSVSLVSHNGEVTFSN